MGGDNSKVEQEQWERREAELRAEQRRHQLEIKRKEQERNELRRAEEELKQLKLKPALLDQPFRDISMDKLNMNKLRDELLKTKSYCEEAVPKLRILLLGMVGHGKTSYVNTIYSTLMNDVVAVCPVGSDTRSITKQFREHKFESGERKLVKGKGGRNKMKAEEIANFRLCDTMGLEQDDGITERDIAYILEGHMKNEYQFCPERAIDRSSAEYRVKPSLKHMIHCVGVCVDASKLTILGGASLDKIRRIKSETINKEISFVVILTKIDTVCQLTKENPAKVFYSPKVKIAVKTAAEIFAVPPNQVYPVKNYESETDIVPAVNILSLYTCVKMLMYANSAVQVKLIPDSDKDSD